MNYPGDLKMRVGRRVCRQDEWVALLKEKLPHLDLPQFGLEAS